MIRITELRLPISHAPEALEEAILKRLQLKPQDLIRTEVFKRSYDASINHAWRADLHGHGLVRVP